MLQANNSQCVSSSLPQTLKSQRRRRESALKSALTSVLSRRRRCEYKCLYSQRRRRESALSHQRLRIPRYSTSARRAWRSIRSPNPHGASPPWLRPEASCTQRVNQRTYDVLVKRITSARAGHVYYMIFYTPPLCAAQERAEARTSLVFFKPS